MAIFHLSAKIVSRETGRTALGAAAYRSGERLQQEGIGGVLHDYSRKEGVAHTEILAPEHAPAWARDRSTLWNEVDRNERRRDAQLAREVELALPVELGLAEQVELLRAYAKTQFVDRGMVADIAIHHDNPRNPHAHILLTLREIDGKGFGAKQRSWNSKEQLRSWREAWATETNEHLARAGHDVRVDHRSFADQGLTLTPGRKIGLALDRQAGEKLPRYLADRVAEQRSIARENGARIVADPALALSTLTHQRATFTERDVATFLTTRTDGAEQFQAALLRVMSADAVVGLDAREHGEGRYTTREMLQIERQMFDRASDMAKRSRHSVTPLRRDAALQGASLSHEQRRAFEYILAPGDLKAVVGVAGSGKSTLLAAAREAWESQGFHVQGATLSGIASENLERASGIGSRTLASLEHGWARDRDRLGERSVLVIDEAGMVGTRQLARVLEAADAARAKVVLLGDPEQLQAIEAGAPFRGVLATVGGTTLEEVRRQQQLWQREATRQLATGRADEALASYEKHRLIHARDTRLEARTALLADWERGRAREGTQLMLAHTRADVRELNEAARELLKAQGALHDGRTFQTDRGEREFAEGERIYFLRNERSLGVKNGSLGTILQVQGDQLRVRLDGDARAEVTVDTKQYRHLDHGYAATIHKGQGSTVERAFVLATPSFDRHLTYVALSRHRESAEVYFAREDFVDRDALKASLGRGRPKDLASDYDVQARVEAPAVSRFQARIQSAFARTSAEIAKDRSKAVIEPEAGSSDARQRRDDFARSEHQRAPEASREASRPPKTRELDLER